MITPKNLPRERRVCPACKAVYGVPPGFTASSFSCRRCGMPVWVRRIPPAIVGRSPTSTSAPVEGGAGVAEAIRTHARRGRRLPRREEVLLAHAVFALAVAVIFALGFVGLRALGSTESTGSAATEIEATPDAD